MVDGDQSASFKADKGHTVGLSAVIWEIIRQPLTRVIPKRTENFIQE